MPEMKCKKCGNPLEPNVKFCPSCGTVQEEHCAAKKMFCEDCGNEIPQGSRMCPNCGCPVPQITPRQARVEGQPSAGKAILTIIAFTLVTFMLIVGGFYGYAKLQEQRVIKAQYEQAASLYNSGNYSAALQIYESFGDDQAAELANKCRYQIGVNAMNSKSWAEAKEVFFSISAENYEDTEELIKQCDEEIKRIEEEQKRIAEEEKNVPKVQMMIS